MINGNLQVILIKIFARFELKLFGIWQIAKLLDLQVFYGGAVLLPPNVIWKFPSL